MTASTAVDRSYEPPRPSPSGNAGRPNDPAVVATLERIDRFADLQPDWDSYGGDPPSSVARAEANRWVEIVADLFGIRVGAAAIPYSVAPLADGGVQLEWRGPKAIVELEVGPAGELGYLFLVHGDAGDHAEEADDASWSDVLRRLLRSFAS